jgi:hypothetical protein
MENKSKMPCSFAEKWIVAGQCKKCDPMIILAIISPFIFFGGFLLIILIKQG